MVRTSKFWDRIANRYSKKPIADEAAYQEKLKITREYLRPDMTVLEFGCGTGSTAIAHAPFVQHIQAIDISANMIEIARGKANAGKAGNVTFAQAAIDDFAGADQTYDAILGLSILHLVEDKEDVIAKVYKMLKPGGVFVSSTVCIGDTMKFLKFVFPIGTFFGVLPLIRVFTANEIQASLTDAGFSIEHRWQPGKGKSVFIIAKKVG